MLRELAICIGLGVASTGAATANGIYLKSDIRATSTGAKSAYDGQVKLLSLDWGMSQDGPLGGGVGCRISQIGATKDIDSTSVDFMLATATGNAIARTAVISLTRNGIDPRAPETEFPALEIYLDDAAVTLYATSVTNDSYAMAESIRLTSRLNKVSAIAYEYNPQSGKLVSKKQITLPCGIGN
jgi:type VI protein secretion system component Hcp